MGPVLVTGFAPWAQYVVNSSEDVVRAVGERLGGEGVRWEVLGVDHLGAWRRVGELLREVRPAACLAMGMWQGSAFRIERYGRRCPGLSGVEGEEELEGAWDWAGMERVLAGSGRAVIHSEDAGKFVCDTTYWSVLDFRKRFGWPGRAAFLHLPPVGGEFTVEVMAGAVEGVVRGVMG